MLDIKKFKLMCWNVRGLGCPKKCSVVRDVLRSSRGDICYFQETKINEVDYGYLARVFPSFFDKNCVYLNAIESRGGLLISWKRSYSLQNSWATKHSCTALLRQNQTGRLIQITNVYGPSTEADKPAFLTELEGLLPLVQAPWLLVGDFNVVRWMIDRSGGMRDFQLMELFNTVIANLQVLEIPLQNRQYTWSSKRPTPTFSRLDRIFVSTELSSQFQLISLKALEMTISDHAPLMLCCRHRQTQPRLFRLEKSWFRYPKMREVIQQVWADTKMGGSQPEIGGFQRRCAEMHHQLSKWHVENFARLTERLNLCKKAVLFFDLIEEKRPLDAREFSLRIKLKERIFELANFEEDRWYQRSRCRWLQCGDRNTSYFHNFASSRERTNSILQITHEGREITNQAEIIHLFCTSMQSILGESSQVLNFDVTALYPQRNDLTRLGSNFTESEIETAVRGLASNKACGPDGLPNEFAKNYWPQLKGELSALITAFFDHSLDLTAVNRANIIFIPKKEHPKKTSDYRPISVINLLPKIISKILANRLAETMPDLISIQQTAFVKGRYIAENFLSTREIIHHLSAGGYEAVFAKVDFPRRLILSIGTFS